MISGRKRGFCPRPLKSPDPDHHNRSVIVCTKSPDIQQPPTLPKSLDFNLLTHQIAQLKAENQRLRAQLEQLSRTAVQQETSRLRALSQEKEEELSNSRTRFERTKESVEQLRRELDEQRRDSLRLLQQKQVEIRELEEVIRRSRCDDESVKQLHLKARQLESENRRLKEILKQSSADSMDSQNRLLMKRMDELMDENEKMKDVIQQFSTGQSSRIRELKQREKELRLELARLAKEGSTPKKEVRVEPLAQNQTVDRLKQHFDKEAQLCRNRLYELREQLVQAQTRLDQSQRTLRQLKVQIKHRKHTESANPERTRSDHSPIALGDQGAVDRIEDDDEPNVTKFDVHSADKGSAGLQESLVRKLQQQEQYAEELLKANRAKDTEFSNISRALKEKDMEVSSLRSTNRILEERVQIMRNQLEELQKQLNQRLQELSDLKRRVPPSRDREIEQLKREIEQLRQIIEGGRPNGSSSEVEGLKRYVLSLNQTLDAQRRRLIKLDSQNQQLRNAAEANFKTALAANSQETNQLRSDNVELQLRIEELYRENQLLKISAVKSASGASTEVDKLSFIGTELAALRETVGHLKKANGQLQDELRRCESVKAEMGYKLNQLMTENQAVGSIVGQLRERQTFLDRELEVKNAQIQRLRSQIHESTRALSGSAAKATQENNRLHDQLSLMGTEMASLKQQLSEFERLKKDYQLIRSSEQRKSSQLDEVMKELAQCRELLTSINLEEIEHKTKQCRNETIQTKSKERVIKISIQKEGLRREVERLKQRVVALSDEVVRLAHERQVLQAEVNRVTQDRQIEHRKTSELSEAIKRYLDTKYQSSQTEMQGVQQLEAQISRQLRELEWPTDLSGLKVSLKRMEQSVQRIRTHLQQFNNSASVA